MRREQWRLKLANLYIELGLAKTFLLEAERASRIEPVERARELIAILMKEISEHRCKPWWSQISAESDDHESKKVLH